MDTESWRRLRELFDAAQELPAAARTELLDRELAGDPELRAEIDSLLDAADSAGAFLAPSAPVPPGGAVIGPYRLTEMLGEGGFGVVWLAEQTRPLQRRVALKLIRPGMDSKQLIGRFDAERQALALMDHPGIAQVYDAGETDDGRPYFVMEHVPGQPLTTFCDRERLPVRARLELFLQVCDAVQHAHQRGVIHRDLKPSNVLVSRRDGVPFAKIIDFGIVKAVGDAFGEHTLLTSEGTIVGTLAYMSPEQAGATSEDVDTRADIYSLGVLLYELLAGGVPFEPSRLRELPLAEALRIIREEDPPGLTARVVRGGEEADAIAAARATDPRTLIRELKGELEWIALRALEKEPERRYASASELAADLRRHLANEPVLAGAPSTMYRVRKFARRHRTGVTAAMLLLLSVVAGGIAAGIGFGRAVRAERSARNEAESSRRVADFLVELFRASTPDRAQGETVTARTLLDEGSRRIEQELQDDPLVRARLLATLGQARQNLGEYDEGVTLLREALTTAESAGVRGGQLAEYVRSLAVGLRDAGQHDEVDSLFDRAIELTAAESPRSSALAACLAEKAQWLNQRTDLAGADSLVSHAIDICESLSPPDTTQLVHLYQYKANIVHRQWNLPEAEQTYLKALALAEATRQPSYACSIHRRLASVYSSLGKADEAMEHAREAVRIAREIFPPQHPQVADALSGEAAALTAAGKWEEAAQVREEALGILRVSDPGQNLLASELNSLGILYRGMGKIDLAIERAGEARDVCAAKYGADSPRTAEMTTNLARCLTDAGRLAAADSAYATAFRHLDPASNGVFFTSYATAGWANVERDLGRFEVADSLYARAESGLDSTKAGTRPYFGECLVDHAYLRSLRGRADDAETMMRTGLACLRGDGPEDDPQFGASYLLWAAARARAGDADGAMEPLRHAASCGMKSADVQHYPELAALRSRPDYPPELLEVEGASGPSSR